jgi:hypothetical protein
MKKYIPLTIGLLIAALLLAFAVGQGRAQERSLAEEGSLPDAADANVGSYFPVQGRLTDASGTPLNGTYSITFRLYTVAVGGTELCHDTNDVQVVNGLFNTEIWGSCQDNITGQQLYLGIQVGTDGEMTPRQPIYAAPYAWSLRPGAVISGTLNADPVVDINNNGTGIALHVSNHAFDSYSVVGMQVNYTEDNYTGNYTSGGLFGGVNGVIGISHETVRVGAGVYGWAQGTTGTGYGVRGQADSTTAYGVYGQATSSTGLTWGVYGRSESTQGYGVYGIADATTGDNFGVYGRTDSTSGQGVHGEAHNTGGGVGVWGESNAGSGLYGISTTGYGAYADTGNATHDYGLFTNDNLYSLNYNLKGAMRQLVQNGGSEPLEAGDVVVFSGVIAPTNVYDPPVILVSKATTADSSAVAGVVYARANLEGLTLEGAAQPGETLLVVIQGPARVKASAAAGAIHPGDPLSSAAQAGFAARTAALPGTVFAKALEALESGEGWIYVFVTLQ